MKKSFELFCCLLAGALIGLPANAMSPVTIAIVLTAKTAAIATIATSAVFVIL